MSDIEETRIVVRDDWTGSRLDRFVRAVRPALSFPVVQTLIRKGKILLNGRKAPGKARLKDGDIVEIRLRGDEREEHIDSALEEPERDSRRAERFGEIGREIPILFEDDDLLVIDKPAGLPVQPGGRSEMGSLLDQICRYIPPRPQTPGEAPPFVSSPVHRLDTGTSGALIVAKTRKAARELSRAISEGQVEKRYLVIVEGVPEDRSGTIDKPLRVEKGDSSKAIPDREGQPAVTHFRLLEEMPDRRALLEIRIETGRTHQIRAHMQSIGHPVAGDRIYGSDAEAGDLPRLLLHAWKISFEHPVAGGTIEITAPPPPEFGL
jgi:RluA family pseudouridine synthase